ncbi:chondroitin sulfate synthase 3 [Canis lupus familiaris]|uniref:Hexosyltransferase n=2 Tax=Canis lupus familiaris TaxID=9615 RepID=A0A8I3NHS7_CANLF|nr:chondroitin sulfate synthase 3 [Canis lupus dingo]XP_038407994.1 chondroitin sulfate synthase 3 [Canis lupus familiaris]XP_038537353.1 chondroitin sulfate synthase 3 [Canis lupus familiaris]XP_538613.1 chondroitin sulfate synthase 3 [Canis lupus familiaris]|eukprot:XP_538613.1 chondroitin sulfate synthase 3 [Canis lupus familiaris]
MAVRSRRPWMSVALGLVLGFTAASWLIAPRVAELSERKRRGSSLCSYYGRSAAGPGAGAQQPLPQPQPRPRPEQSAPPARPELPGPPLPEAAPGVTSFRSSPWQQPAPLQQRRRGREPEGATGLPGAPVAEGDPEEEDGGAAGPRRSGRPGSNHNGSGDGGAAAPSSRPRDFLYVGVMTAQKYLGSRALAAQRTWARFIPGRVEFFSSEQSPNAGASQPPPPLPVIALPGVDDSYPPQKKSFMMIKYMHDHYLDKYEWFMRADDDVYIKGDKLEEFLRSLNSSKPLYLGQTGLGNIEELGKLGLEPGENFCMGGPGMIFSREVLRRMVPHIGECLREMYTTHEDVEVGRCVRRFGGTQCVWSYEMQQLFHENYEHNRKGYIQDLHNSKIHAAITLHPNKRPAYQYRLHNYMLSRKISELRYRTIQLHRESALMSKLSNSEVSKEDQQLGVMPSFNHFQPRDRDEVIEWEFLMGKLLYSASENQPPRQNINSILRTALDDTVLQVMEMINENAKSRGRLIDFKEIQYGYRRVDPMHGVEYILDLLLLYKRHKGRKLTVPVRRHAYLQQLFSKPFFRETEELDVNSLVESINSDTQSFSFISNSLKILSSFQGAKEMEGHHEKKIHILVPLVGRYDIFLRFMDNFEKTCLIPKQNVKLVITLFSRDSGQDSNKHIELIKEYQNRYPNAEMTLIPMKGEFSRGLGLEMASSQFDNDTLLLFCDVDLIFRGDFLQRCRDNTIQGQQVYYPIIFSQYDPKVTNGGNPPTDDDFVFSKKTGFWRDYGYGITCIYKSDLLGAGGFDTSIQGWGLEDVDLYNKVILSGLRPFRSQEVGVVHIFHPVHCDPNLDPKQYKMCLGSKASTFASTMQLAELWLEKHLGVRYNRTLS